MGNPFEHMRRPGTPPPPPRGRMINPDQLEEVPCAGCKSVYRRVIRSVKHVRDRLTGKKVADAVQEWYLCAGCGVQVDTAGEPVSAYSSDVIPQEILKEARRE